MPKNAVTISRAEYFMVIDFYILVRETFNHQLRIPGIFITETYCLILDNHALSTLLQFYDIDPFYKRMTMPPAIFRLSQWLGIVRMGYSDWP